MSSMTKMVIAVLAICAAAAFSFGRVVVTRLT